MAFGRKLLKQHSIKSAGKAMDTNTQDDINAIGQALRKGNPAALEVLAAKLIGHLLGSPVDCPKDRISTWRRRRCL